MDPSGGRNAPFARALRGLSLHVVLHDSLEPQVCIHNDRSFVKIEGENLAGHPEVLYRFVSISSL
jgi:hypothetical protein